MRFRTNYGKISPMTRTLLYLLGLFCSSSSSVRRLMIGIPKASVFPVPVFARAMRSRPSSAGTSTALCVVAGKHIAINQNCFKENKKNKPDQTSNWMKKKHKYSQPSTQVLSDKHCLKNEVMRFSTHKNKKRNKTRNI